MLSCSVLLARTLKPLALGTGIILALRQYFNGQTAPITDRTGKRSSTGLSTAEDLLIGGVKQFVLTRGTDRSNPVLLVLHGGPGDSEAALFAHSCPGLENHFVVVHWDQRGSGRSFTPKLDRDSLNIRQLVEDAHELTMLLQDRFKSQPIIVLGHSWGSYLGLQLVHEYPDEYVAYIGVGQVADQIESEHRGFEWLMNSAREEGNDRALGDLRRVGPPRNGRYRGGLRGMSIQRRWIRHFGGAAVSHGNLGVLWLFAWPLIRAREYRLIDKFRYLQGEAVSMAKLQEPMLDDPPRRNLTKFELPIFVVQGRKDHQTDTPLAAEYLAALTAPRKELVIMEDAAHLAPFEKPEEFVEIVTNLISDVLESPPPTAETGPK